jgi:DNA-binding transcriptional MerR regulator
MKRRGNRRYYQHHEVLLVRRIRDLLYEQGFTISGARNRLGEAAQNGRRKDAAAAVQAVPLEAPEALPVEEPPVNAVQALRADLLAVLALLHPEPPSRG